MASSNIRQPRQQITQNCLLLWVDASIDLMNKDSRHKLTQLKSIINDIHLCTQPDQCIELLTQADNERVFVITSDSLGKHLVPAIHGMPQLDAIYIFSDKKLSDQEWTQNWTKIKGVHTNMKEIYQVLQLAVKQYNQDFIAISFLMENEIASTFMNSLIFKDILPRIGYDRKAIKRLAASCREIFTDNTAELKIIDEFQRNYHPQEAIWWYTRECFIYQMVNRAFQVLDVDIIIKMGFFLRDLHEQIQNLYEQQVSNYGRKPFVVYRGQGLMKPYFEKLEAVKGGLMSFDSFLSTTKDKEVSLHFARNASTKSDMVGILFIMFIDPCLNSAPFASIKEMSYFKAENEILFSMYTVFRVDAIKQMDNKNQLYQVELQLISDDDEKRRLRTYRRREVVRDNSRRERFINLLVKISQFNKTDELYNVLFEQRREEAVKKSYYEQLGSAYLHQGNYEKAIWYYEKVLEIQKNPSNIDYHGQCISYCYIGMLYANMEEYSKAVTFYEKVLEIGEIFFPSNDPLMATSYNNIGLVYYNIKEYSKALSYYERALDIWQHTLPSTHPHINTVKESIEIVKKKL
ncbi:unnamed protein product [Adineta steineri]|uniref:NAD(P)(+)--arginine ADP-ribosyltransferase n=1 Tax=Adineta steineri TaxID=433720 RepID=A0A819T280_9BILA|nr:unnamed protein product [Adineta steineri]CAF4070641.1 unnamed protein product [Adineta steineri]